VCVKSGPSVLLIALLCIIARGIELKKEKFISCVGTRYNINTATDIASHLCLYTVNGDNKKSINGLSVLS
jgi:hypothetical protein